jgi:hypothetical protein
VYKNGQASLFPAGHPSIEGVTMNRKQVFTILEREKNAVIKE